MNQLLVAQALKAEKDKALSIISSQITKAANDSTAKYVFGGCERLGYPSFSGSLCVTDLIPNGVKLASGHILLYGSCTKSVKFSKGDVINFAGYLKDGIIHALNLSK